MTNSAVRNDFLGALSRYLFSAFGSSGTLKNMRCKHPLYVKKRSSPEGATFGTKRDFCNFEHPVQKVGCSWYPIPIPVISFDGPISLQQKNFAQLSPISSLHRSDVGLRTFLLKWPNLRFLPNSMPICSNPGNFIFFQFSQIVACSNLCPHRKNRECQVPLFSALGAQNCDILKNSKFNNSKPEV